MPSSLLILLATPFLLILPGWFVTATLFPASDRLEKSTLSALLSMFIVYSGLFTVEKIAGKLTLLTTVTAIAVINLACLGLFLFTRRVHVK